MSYILERLYLGDIDDAYRTKDLRERKGVTHILTLDCKPLSVEVRQGFSYLHIHALDTDDFDILSQLECGLKFIDDGRESGAVFVHCWAGQSRSAAMVLAYVMKSLQLTVDEAESLIRTQRSSIKPNAGFITQLNLFYEMNYHVDITNQLYRKYRLERLAQQMQRGYCTVEYQCRSNVNVTAISTRVDRSLPNCPGGQMSRVLLSEQVPLDYMSADPSTMQSDSSDMVYRCAKCRRALFRQSGVVMHNVFTGNKTQFKGHHGSNGKVSSSSVCDIFIEPVAWMASMILSIEGKLSCPKCSAKIGSFNWAGARCPCGSWVTPAFHVQKSKVDACPTAAAVVIPAQLSNRLPPLGLVVMNSPDGQASYEQQIAT